MSRLVVPSGIVLTSVLATGVSDPLAPTVKPATLDVAELSTYTQ
jgi:hypothetical protein